MTPEAQRIKIAEACGWHSFRDIGGDSGTKLWGHPSTLMHTSLPTELVPDYLNDLNAMHDAEAALLLHEQTEFMVHLTEITDSTEFLRNHASASQRAEALLRTKLNLWTD
jgi:hypothetical protein